jgi:hypothetical protein
MNYVFGLDGDETIPVTGGSDDATVNPAEAVISFVGKGNRFYAFAEPQSVEGMNVDFSQAATCSNKASENQTAIDAVLANPPTGVITPA